MTNTTSAHQPTDATNEFDRWLEANTTTDASRKALGKHPWYITIVLRAIYLAGVIGLGYVTATWAMSAEVGIPAVPAIGLTVVIETFVLVAFYYSVRARLRGEMSWHLRSFGYLGVAISAGIQIAWHYDDKPGLPVMVTAAGVLSAISWTLDQHDRHATVFRKQDAQRRAKRAQRWAAIRSSVGYMFATSPWRAMTQWRRRTANVGNVARNVDETLAVRSHEARANVVNAELMPANAATPIGPFPPRAGVIGRPVSAPPAQVVIGDDVHAQKMRELGSMSACARYAAHVKGPTVGAAELMIWLAGYGIHLNDSTVRGARLAVWPRNAIEAKRPAND